MEFIYRVVTNKGVEEFDSPEELTAKYTQIGIVESTSAREELQGQPRLLDLYGAMYDGKKDGKHVIRYESKEVYDMLSR